MALIRWPAAEGKKTVLAAGGFALDELQPLCARGHRVLDTCWSDDQHVSDDICQITAYGIILKYCITVYCQQISEKKDQMIQSLVTIISWGDGIFLLRAVGEGLQLSKGDHRLDWSHQVGALLQQWFDNWPTKPPEGSLVTPAIPGVTPTAVDPLLALLLLLLGPDAVSHLHSEPATGLFWSARDVFDDLPQCLSLDSHFLHQPRCWSAQKPSGANLDWIDPHFCIRAVARQLPARSTKGSSIPRPPQRNPLRVSSTPLWKQCKQNRTKAGDQVWGLLPWSQRGSIAVGFDPPVASCLALLLTGRYLAGVFFFSKRI